MRQVLYEMTRLHVPRSRFTPRIIDKYGNPLFDIESVTVFAD